jgi:SNF2 family DNA or RNA helicase
MYINDSIFNITTHLCLILYLSPIIKLKEFFRVGGISINTLVRVRTKTSYNMPSDTRSNAKPKPRRRLVLGTRAFEAWLENNNLDRKQHQIDGVKFCLKNETSVPPRGGLVADEMGLGKTYIMLGTMISNPKKTLIVLPKSLLNQWVNIVDKYFGEESRFIFHGDYKNSTTKFSDDTPVQWPPKNPKREGTASHARYEKYKHGRTIGESKKLGASTEDIRSVRDGTRNAANIKIGDDNTLTPVKQMEKVNIVITTYGQISKNKKKDDDDQDNLLYGIKWGRVIFDEGHHLRNIGTSRYDGVNLLNCPVRWLITGTPIQNRMKDFYSLCSIMGIDEDFAKNHENHPKIKKDYMLKRTKCDVGIHLPECVIHTPETDPDMVIPWNNSQEKNVAEEIHSMLPFANISKSKISNSVNLLGGTSSVRVLPYLIRARQACVYPKLLKNRVQKYLDDDEELQEEDEFMNATEYSSKIDGVINFVLSRNNGRSKLIFCHFRGEIDIMHDKFAEKGLYVRTFDGRTSHNQRNDILENTCDVLILQIQTGCEGLNLQQFKEVYFVSPNWNPAIEEQAIARCHRIGQTDAVDVFRFIMEDMDDESMNLEQYCKTRQSQKMEIIKKFDEA